MVSSQLARFVDICCHVYIVGYDERSTDTNKHQLLSSQTRELGRKKYRRTFEERLARFKWWLYCLDSGEEHDEVDDAASLGSVMKHLRVMHWKKQTQYYIVNKN